MGIELNRKRPYGRISGTLENCPGARFSQDGMFFDAVGLYLMDTDGTTDNAPDIEEEQLLPVESTGADLKAILRKAAAKMPAFLIPLSDDEIIKLLIMAKEKDIAQTKIDVLEFEAESRAARKLGLEEEE